MEQILSAILSYLISLAANFRTDAIIASREAELKERLEQEDAVRKAVASTRPLRDEVHAACAELARDRYRLGVTAQEEPLWRLLSDELFQGDLVEWLMAGGIEEGNAVRQRLLQRMETVLVHANATPEQITFLRSGYFDAVERAIFTNPLLVHWRHQLSLDYLREQVTVLRQRAEESAGRYSPDKQEAALDRYCEKALSAWDIIDLSNLPEGDIHIATQKLLLRQLYIPLRVDLEPSKRGKDDVDTLTRLGRQREARPDREAIHVATQETDSPTSFESRYSVGECLIASRRLVILGDPGGGKTTMLRWMATAYLLRHKGDDAFNLIPDTETLPSQSWIPVLIRCRDLGEADLCHSFTDFLTQHLNKTELLPEEADIMRAVILDRLATGTALVLVDGLDEITNPHVRMIFCQELERTAARYPDAPIVVTSRIVGYRDMPYRMGSGFEHGIVAELSREDKDLFAQRWVDVTEQHRSAAEKTTRVRELLDALHSSDRIERLTGSPMLLTTLALVKRKVGKLPNRRNKLYAEAVSVLLNWNPRIYKTIEEDEAIPQLGYLAYEMCRRGVQRLTDDEVLDLLERIRTEYPNVRAIRLRDASAFLALLEERSSILIRAGGIWNKAREKAVWEFRHLTFQEYLAARALIDGRYPNRDKSKTLAEQVAPLAGPVQTESPLLRVGDQHNGGAEYGDGKEVPESWREALRLLVTDCNDDDVDDVLLAILNPLPHEDPASTIRSRVSLAALCLADEPNVGEHVSETILARLSQVIVEEDILPSDNDNELEMLEPVVRALATSIWATKLGDHLVSEYVLRDAKDRLSVGSLLGTLEASRHFAIPDFVPWYAGLPNSLASDDPGNVIRAALGLMHVAYERALGQRGLLELPELPELPGVLISLLEKDPAQSMAGAWALAWLDHSFYPTSDKPPLWKPTASEIESLVLALERAPSDETHVRRFLVHIIANVDPEVSGITVDTLAPYLSSQDAQLRGAVVTALARFRNKRALTLLLARLDDPDTAVRVTVHRILGQMGDKQAVLPLLAKLDDADTNVRRTVARSLGQLGDKQAVPALVARLDDPDTAVRSAIIQALGLLGDSHTATLLMPRLDDRTTAVRRAAAVALGQLGNKQAVPALLARLGDRASLVRNAVKQALERLGHK